MYVTLKFIHVMSAVVWIGGVLWLSLVVIGMLRAQDYAGAQSFNRQTNTLGRLVFGPTALTTVAAGIAMVLVGDLSFGDTWIVIGLIGVALSFIIGGVLGDRTGRALEAALLSTTSGVPDHDDHAIITQLRQRLAAITAANLTILTVVVWAMVVKP